MKLRVQFAKHGSMKFIGHLDTMRYFQKAIRRSGIDISYTTGFSPHQMMSFAAPLGVGHESDSEYMDIEVNSISSSDQMIKSLNDQMVDGFSIIDIRLLPDNAPNAMASVQAASYTVGFRDFALPTFSLENTVEVFKASDTVLVTKKTKKSEIQLDLKPSVYDLHMENDFLIYMLVDASSGGNIKPELVIRKLFSFADCDLPENALKITRKETYGRSSEGTLIPLINFGNKF